jgi:hypothetical protein
VLKSLLILVGMLLEHKHTIASFRPLQALKAAPRLLGKVQGLPGFIINRIRRGPRTPEVLPYSGGYGVVVTGWTVDAP